MQIFIRTLVGKKVPYTVELTDTILRLKEILQEKEGIQVEQVRLIYGGKQLEDSKTIQSSQVEAGSTLHMILQLRGG
jgi:ubiquitin-like protein Nedd8